MRSTIQLSGERKAVVDIPYTTLAPHQDKNKENPHVCCQSKIVVTGGGSNKSSSKVQIRRMVQQMEEAYDRDVKAYEAKIGQLQQDKATTASHLQKQRRQFQAQLNSRRLIYEKQNDLLREEGKRKDSEIRRIQQQKQLLLRSKINEFKQVQYIDRINQLTHIVRLKDCEIKELASKYDLINTERNNNEERSRSNQLKLEEQISRLSLQLTTTTNNLVNEQTNIAYASRLKQQESNKLLQQLKYHLQKAEKQLRQCQYSNEEKDKQITALNQKIKVSQQRVAQLESQSTQLKDSISQLTTLKYQLSQEITVCRKTIVFLNDEKERLLIELDTRFREIDHLRIDLHENQRVYQVKIERVIDGKQQIEQLQATIYQLQQQIKQINQDRQYLTQDIAKLKAEIHSYIESKLKLQGEITGLKAYIEKREGSFRWAVEREIEKDIIVSDQRPQTYKVSHVAEYSRVKNGQTHVNKLISEQIGLQMQANLFGSYPEQINLQKFRQ